LTVTERAHSREWLAALLWPDVETSRTQLRIALSLLRQRLGDAWIDGSRGEVGLRREAVWSDVWQIKATAARQSGEQVTADEIDAVNSLYRYDLLAGFSLPDAPEYDAWQWAEEQKLRNAFWQMLYRHINTLMASTQPGQAIPHAQRLVELDPLNEEARRLLIQLYIDTHQRHNALLEYQNTHAALQKGLGLEPEPATRALYERLQQSAAPSVPQEPFTSPPSHAILPTREILIGRDKELDTLVQAFTNHERLITIVGPSGIGKTHLAIMLGHRIVDGFGFSAYFMSFASAVTGTGLLEMLTRVFQAPSLLFGDLLEAVILNMKSRRCLIILDNFEPADGAANVIQALLETAPHLSMIVTSQGSLSLKQELCFPLQGLFAAPLVISTNEPAGAIDLFLHTAHHVNPHFSADAALVDDIRQICILTQGMPLAIILAAAWCDVLQPREIVAEIEANYDFLRTDYLDVPERHRSIRAVFDAVWARLSPVEKQALVRLSVFRGGFGRHAAQMVSQVSVSLLKQMVTKSLVTYSSGDQRYVLHDLLRQYLAEHMDEETLRSTQIAHCGYFAEYAAAREKVITGQKQDIAWHELDIELPNLRAAWGNALALHKFDVLLRMIEPLRLFFQISGLWEQGLMLFDQARQLTRQTASEEMRWLHTKLLSRLYDDDGHVEKNLLNALTTAELAGDGVEIAHVQTELGWRALVDTDYRAAVMWFEKAIAHYENHPNPFAVGLLHKGLAYAAIGQFKRDTARLHMQVSLRLRRGIGDLVGEHELIVLRGELNLLDGALDAARHDLLSAFTYFSTSFSYGSALLRVPALGWAYVLLGEWDAASQHIQGLMSLSTNADYAIVRACGLSMELFANVLRGDDAALERNLDQLAALSIETLTWPSTMNLDLRFMIYLSRLYGYVTLMNWFAAQQALQRIAADGYWQHQSYRMWLLPLCSLLVDAHYNRRLESTTERPEYRSFVQQKWIEIWQTRYVNVSDHHDADDGLAKRDTLAGLAEILCA
jgi:predicted ATPase/DNA-binding SARP family transcriptional activator